LLPDAEVLRRSESSTVSADWCGRQVSRRPMNRALNIYQAHEKRKVTADADRNH